MCLAVLIERNNSPCIYNARINFVEVIALNDCLLNKKLTVCLEFIIKLVAVLYIGNGDF